MAGQATAAAGGQPDPDRLLAWAAAAAVPLDPPVTLALIAGGRSNLTFRVQDSAARSYVLRRPPLGPTLTSAHDVLREARVITALAGSAVPVPPCHGSCEDPGVIGAPFYLMACVPGTVVASRADGEALSRGARRALSEQLVRVLARLHAVDVDAVGLGRLGRREDYLQRQMRRWHRQFHESTDREVPLIDELHRRLVAAAPPQRYTGLVHGDYRPGNVLADRAGNITAVLDWELCTLGDTLADLGWLLATWVEPGEAELHESPTGHPGFLSRTEMAALYARETGREVSGIGFYVAFSLWRLACIYEGIYARYRGGAMGAHDLDVEAQGRRVVALAEAAAAALPRA